MTDGRKCGGCGARVTKDEARFCDYCGAELPRLAPEPPRERSGSERFEDAFAALAEHPEYERLLAFTPSTSKVTMGYGCGAAFGVLFAVVSLVIMGGFQKAGAPFPFSMFPFLFVGIGIFVVVFSLSRAAKFSKAPLGRRRARIAGERTRVSGGGENSSASTSYYVTLEYESGRREEFSTSGKVVGEVSEGDMGIAYLKGGHLLAFERLRV
jgi:hypothetical protein